MNRLPETVSHKFNELFAVISRASDDLKIAGAEASMAGNFSLVTVNIENCQHLQALELEIKTCLSNFESIRKNQTHEKRDYKYPRNRTLKLRGQYRVNVGYKVVEGPTLVDVFVKTLKVFGLERVAKLNKVLT